MRAELIVLILQVAMCTYSEACGCPNAHPQNQFCDADFVIKARVLNTNYSSIVIRKGPILYEEYAFYTVNIIQDYKRNQLVPQIQYIYTPADGSYCGEDLAIGFEYIILGRIQNERWITTHCNGNTPVAFLSSYQKDAYRFGYYKQGCECKVFECHECPPKSPDNCILRQDRLFSAGNCFKWQNSCQRRGDVCTWDKPPCNTQNI